jgi:hypothetical protein
VNAADQLIKHLLEAEEDFGDEDVDVKELTLPGEEVVAGPTTVKRVGATRMKIVDMPRYTFLISYLTPVAYYDKIFRQYFRTLKHWSPTTNDHISQWQSMIAKTPEWKDNPDNWEPSTWNPEGHYVRYPTFKRLRQERISKLFRELVLTMEMKPHMKRRMYHVDPRMRSGSGLAKGWLSGHLKHHDTGHEGLPSPDDPGYEDFFADFDPDKPEIWDWSSGLRNLEPHERGKPDEE